MSLGTRIRGFVEFTRPGNAVAASILTSVGAFVAGATPSDTLVVVVAMFVTVFVTGAGNAVNDYFDRDTDRISRPDRPISRDVVTAPGAKRFGAALFGGAVVSAFVLPVVAITIAVANLVTLPAYTEFFKGLPGVDNAVAAALTSPTFLFGSAATSEPSGATILCVFAALATLTHEVARNIEDIGGGREKGLQTLPIVVDKTALLWLSAIVLMVIVGAGAVPLIRGEFGLMHFGVIVPADVFMLAATTQSSGSPAAAQRRLKHGILLAAFTFILEWAAAPTGSLL